MQTMPEIVIFAKYIAAIVILAVIILAPAWLARQNKRGKQDMILVRLASWIFIWTGVGWLWALFWATKK